jgi:myosin-crossreactive antigen
MDLVDRNVTVPAPMGRNSRRGDAKVYLVGGGIASLAAAAFMIRDGDILGRDITIIEESDKIGGSLDGAGSPRDGYVLRGGRMLERKYLCTYDLFSSIPTLDGTRTVTDDIERQDGAARQRPDRSHAARVWEDRRFARRLNTPEVVGWQVVPARGSVLSP